MCIYFYILNQPTRATTIHKKWIYMNLYLFISLSYVFLSFADFLFLIVHNNKTHIFDVFFLLLLVFLFRTHDIYFRISLWMYDSELFSCSSNVDSKNATKNTQVLFWKKWIPFFYQNAFIIFFFSSFAFFNIKITTTKKIPCYKYSRINTMWS